MVRKFANVVIGFTGFFSGWAALHLDFQGRIGAGGAAWAKPVNPFATLANFITTLTHNMVVVIDYRLICRLECKAEAAASL